MIGTVYLDELAASVSANLATHIGAVNTAHTLTLDTTFTFYKWHETLQMQKRPCVYLVPVGTITQSNDPAAGIRRERHRFLVGYARTDNNLTRLEQHLLYVPEALLRWMDSLAVGSVATGQLAGINETPNTVKIHYGMFPAAGSDSIEGAVEIEFEAISESPKY